MLKLNVESIKDFQICERLYDYRYLDKIPEKISSRDILLPKFESTIKNIIFFFWYKKQAGVTPSYISLLNRWEKLWFPKEVTSYDLIIEQHETVYANMASMTTKAAGILLAFHEKYANSDFMPIGIQEDYIDVIEPNLVVEDKFDLILVSSNQIDVVKILFNYRNSNRFAHQIDFASMYSAFAKKHPKKIHLAKFGYIDILSANVNIINYEITKEDIDAYEYWSSSVLDKKVFVPRRGLTSYCKKCPFDDPCSKWNDWK